MAIENAKTLNVRIRNKYDSYENWVGSNLVLEAGEIAIAYTTVDVTVDNGTAKHPALLMKVGDGTKTFANLPWLSAKAADVLAVCKDEEALTEFVNSVIADAGIATDEAMQTLAGRVTTAEGKITTLEGKMTTAEGKITTAESAIEVLQGLIGDKGSVEAQIDAKIAALNLAGTYEAKGEAAKVQTALDTYKTSNDAAVQKNATDIAGEISRAKVAEEANTNAINAIKDGTTIDSFADVEAALAGKQGTGDYATKAEAQAMADGKDAAIQAAHKAGTDAATAAGVNAAAIEALQSKVGESSVEAQINTKIADLKLSETYDAIGSAAAAETAAKGHADSLNTAMNTRVLALEAIDHDHSNKTVLDGITAEKVAAWDGAEAAAKTYADGLNTAMDSRVDALEAKFTGEDSVADQIADAVAAEAKLRDDADKALQALIEANDADILALQGLVGESSVESRVNAEKERAMAAEKANADAIKAISDDYLKAADKEALQTQINTIMSNPDAEGAINSINEFTQYINDHKPVAEAFRTDINKNATDIAAETLRATGVEGGLDTRLQAVEAAVGAEGSVAGAIADALAEAKEYTDDLAEGAVATNAAAIEALQTKVGESSVEAQINAALKVDGKEKYALATDLAATNTEVAKKANDEDLAAIAKTGSTDDLVQGAMTLIFDCGGAN